MQASVDGRVGLSSEAAAATGAALAHLSDVGAFSRDFADANNLTHALALASTAQLCVLV